MRARVVVLAGAALCACSIDFVALEDLEPRTQIAVASEHTDSVRVTVEIEQTGPPPTSWGVDGQRWFPILPSVKHPFRFEKELSADPGDPFVDVHVDQSANQPLELRVPLLVRSGEAACRADGSVELPATFDPSAFAGLRRSWAAELLDVEGGAVASIRANGDLPRPLVLSTALTDEPVTSVRIEVHLVGAIPDAPHPAGLALATGAVWEIACG